ncbi:MAG TPA: fasciclin domain-containing protein [Nannocystis sp.]|jgi:uncharacterized surface protein with fasciclin (FAS1) repeats
MFKVLLIPALLLLACKSDGASSTPPDAATQPETPPADDVTPQTSEDNGDDASKPEESADPPAKPAAAASKDVLATVEAQANGKTFAELIVLTDLAKQLRSMDGAGFTVLVPTDDAFKSLPKGQIEKWKKNPAELERVLKFHIVAGTHDVGKLGNFRTAPTTLGKDVDVKVEESDVRIGGAKLTETDIKASNGYVHIIDKVLVPKK